MIRIALDGARGVTGMTFDFSARRLTILHTGEMAEIAARLDVLGLGARVASSAELESGAAEELSPRREAAEARTLRTVLAINAAMFAVEFVMGWIAESTGLIADSLDMFADAAVYSLSLYAVGRAAHLKLRAAHLSGWLQFVLALGAVAEVIRRLLFGSEPEPSYMMGIALLALAANVTCLMVLFRHRSGGTHMKASWIFTTNDVLANLGVIVAGLLVAWTGSRYPDLVMGSAIGAVVLAGAIRILRLR